LENDPKLTNLKDVKKVVTGSSIIVLKNYGTVWAGGADGCGQLGTGTYSADDCLSNECQNNAKRSFIQITSFGNDNKDIGMYIVLKVYA